MSKFVSIALLALVSVVVVSGNMRHADGGESKIHQKQDVNGNYDFGYQIKDPWGASNFRRESGDAWGNVQGSYGLADVDGRQRMVEYVADKDGFRLALQSNEPTIGNLDSADAIYNGPNQKGSATYIPSGQNGKDSWTGDNKYNDKYNKMNNNNNNYNHKYNGYEGVPTNQILSKELHSSNQKLVEPKNSAKL